MAWNLRSLTVLAFLVGGTLAASAPAFAADPAKAAAGLAKQAAKALEAGDAAKAAGLWFEAHRTDPKKAEYLALAASAAQKAGQFERAEELYRTLLALPGVDAANADRATASLKEARSQRGEAKAREAEAAGASGDFATAHLRWLEAYGIDSDRHAWLARAALAAHRAGNANAKGLLEQYGRAAPHDAPEHVEVDPVLARLRADEAAVLARAATPADEGAGSAWVGHAVGWSGVAVAGAGLTVWLMANADRAALDEKLAMKDPVSQQIIGIAKTDARAEADRIAGSKTMAAALGGVGVAAAAAGAWLVLSAPTAKAMLVPGPDGRGMGVAWRF